MKMLNELRNVIKKNLLLLGIFEYCESNNKQSNDVFKIVGFEVDYFPEWEIAYQSESWAEKEFRFVLRISKNNEFLDNIPENLIDLHECDLHIIFK
jgi:hypothetical protein